MSTALIDAISSTIANELSVPLQRNHRRALEIYRTNFFVGLKHYTYGNQKIPVPPELTNAYQAVWRQMRQVVALAIQRTRQRGGDAAARAAEQVDRVAVPVGGAAAAADAADAAVDASTGEPFDYTLERDQAFGGSLRILYFKPRREEFNLNAALIRMRRDMLPLLRDEYSQHHALRFWVGVSIQYARPRPNGDEIVEDYGATSAALNVSTEEEISHKLGLALGHIRIAHDVHLGGASGLVINRINYFKLGIGRRPTLFGAAKCKLPAFLASKKCIINVENEDNRCFGYAICSAFFADRIQRPEHPQRPANYTAEMFAELGLDRIQYPINLAKLQEIESQLRIPFNVYRYWDKDGRCRYPCYTSKLKPEERRGEVIDLLYFEDHFAWIKSFDRFMSERVRQKHHSRSFWCKKCFGRFYKEETLKTHEQFCERPDYDAQIFELPPPGSVCKFIDFSAQQELPFVIYADFEAYAAPCHEKKKHTTLYAKHKPMSVCVRLVSRQPDVMRSRYELYTGEDCALQCLNIVRRMVDEALVYLNSIRDMEITELQEQLYELATKCYMCNKEFTATDHKVHDHNHYTGVFVGPAHNSCNLRRRKDLKVPVFFHNLRNYDMHFIVKELDKLDPKPKVRLIAQSMEKFLTLRIGDHIVFKDSYMFLQASLEKLVANLCNREKNPSESAPRPLPDAFKHLREAFGDRPELFELMKRKQVFCYEYVTGMEKLDEQQLPPREAFFDHLREKECSAEDYTQAQNVWRVAQCRTLKDYMELYLKADVALLADVYENFRDIMYNKFQLDPAHYLSLAQFAWEAMLKLTKAEIGLISDPEMFRLIDGGIRGGLCQVSKRYAEANAPGLPGYDPTKPDTHIRDYDVNNLYGTVMTKPQPIGDFKWMSSEEYAQLEDEIREGRYIEGARGYFFEVDLEYPPELHESHNDLPFCPERMTIEAEQLSETQHHIYRQYHRNRYVPNAKLVASLWPKKKYAIHHSMLHEALRHGLRVTKFHRGISFKQEAFMKDYILSNNLSRRNAPEGDEFERNLWKLLNNAVFGKCCENQKDRHDAELCFTRERWERLLERPQFMDVHKYTADYALVKSRKTRVKITKPFQVGMAILEWSKAHMYRLWYDHLQRAFGKNIELLMMDTDSFIVLITAPDVDAWERRKDMIFDYSKYPRDHPLYSLVNKDVLGLLKNEMPNGILKAVCLAPKMYALLGHNPRGGDPKTTAKGKGIQTSQLQKLRFDDYYEQLFDPHLVRLQNRRFQSKQHEIGSYEISKAGPCAFDNKRLLCKNMIDTIAFGNIHAPGQFLHDAPAAEGYDLVERYDPASAAAPSRHHWRNGLEHVRRIFGEEAKRMHIEHRVFADAHDFVHRLASDFQLESRGDPKQMEENIKRTLLYGKEALLYQLVGEANLWSRVDPQVELRYREEVELDQRMRPYALDRDHQTALDLPPPPPEFADPPADWHPDREDGRYFIPASGPHRQKKPRNPNAWDHTRKRKRIDPRERDIPAPVAADPENNIDENEDEPPIRRRRRPRNAGRGVEQFFDREAEVSGDDDSGIDEEGAANDAFAQAEMADFIVSDNESVGGDDIYHANLHPMDDY